LVLRLHGVSHIVRVANMDPFEDLSLLRYLCRSFASCSMLTRLSWYYFDGLVHSSNLEWQRINRLFKNIIHIGSNVNISFQVFFLVFAWSNH
jgi:hypothetical protein